MDALKALENFITFVRDVRNYSPATILTYRRDLKQFITYLGTNSTDDITIEKIDQYIRLLRSRDLSTNTVASYTNAIKSFMFYLNREGINTVPYAHIFVPKHVRTKVRVLTPEEANALLGAVRKPIHRIAILLLFTTGMRISEFVNIRVEDIDFDNCTIQVTLKGGDLDIVDVEKTLLDYIHLYLYLELVESGYAFRGRDNKRIGTGNIRDMLESVSKQANIPHVSPHAFRRGYATQLAINGADIIAIMELMHHKNAEMAKRYIHMAGEQRKKRHNMYAPKIISSNLPLTNDNTSASIPTEFWSQP